MLLDGKMVRDALLENAKQEIEKEHLDLTLAIIYAGHYEPSEKYINNKKKFCKRVGIKVNLYEMPDVKSEEEIITLIEKLNKDNSVNGIILQSPIPKGLDIEECIKHIDPRKDVDGFTKESFYKLAHNLPGLRACTPKGIIKLLEYYNIELSGKKVCIIGRGNIVGKPLIFEILNKDATVTIAHSKSGNLKEITLNSDVIVSAVGKPHIITENMVKDGAIVVDVGITVIDGKIVGDVDFDNVKNKCSYITPNPGGVGPMTIAMIIQNVIDAYKGGNIDG